MISERINSSIIDAFKSSISEYTSETTDNILKEKVDNDLHVNLIKRFEQKYGLRNIKKLIRKGFTNRQGILRKTEDIKLMDFYIRYLYEDLPDDNTTNYDETILIKDKIYELSLEQFEDELRTVLDSRRSSHLPFVIE